MPVESSRARASATLPAHAIAAVAALAPLFAIHLCLAISIGTGALAPTWPYFDGATSISRACRQPPAVHVFRALVISSAPLGALTWWIAAQWLAARGFGSRAACRWVLGLGVVGALFLVLYASYLGTEGRVYGLLRRYGIYVCFGATSLAELVVTIALHRARPSALEPWVRRAMVAVCALLLAAGPVNMIADHIVEHDRVANVLEWWFGIAMIGFPLLLARVWSREGLRLDLR